MAGNTQFIPGFTKKKKKSKRKSTKTKKPEKTVKQQQNSTIAVSTVKEPEIRKHEVKMAGFRKTNVKSGWVPKGEFVEVAGRAIGGLVYIANSDLTDVSVDEHLNCSGCIDLAKPVHGHDSKGELLKDYDYSDMEPACRASYLDWLAGGKKSKNFHPAYAQMYYWGLERRLVWDYDLNNETEEIIEEILRLRSEFSTNTELVRLINRQFDYQAIAGNPMDSSIRYPNEFLELPLELAVEISDSLYEGRPLTGRQMFQWLRHDYPSSQYDGFDFQELEPEFMKEFSTAYPDGMLFAKPDRPYPLDFESKGDDFRVRDTVDVNGRPMLDFLSLEDPLRKVESILDGITGKMPKPARADVKAPGNGMSLLKLSLSGNRNNATIRTVQKMYPNIVNWARKKARSRTPINSLELIDLIADSNDNPIEVRNWKHIVDALALIGFGLAPHVTFLKMNQGLDEPAFLYESEVNHLKWKKKGKQVFHFAMYRLGIAVPIYFAGGLEPDTIRTKLWNVGSVIGTLSKSDNAGVHANIEYLLLCPPDNEFFERICDPEMRNWNTKIKPLIIEYAMDLDLEHEKKVAIVKHMYGKLNLDTNQAEPDVRNAKSILSQSKWISHRAKGVEPLIMYELNSNGIRKL